MDTDADVDRSKSAITPMCRGGGSNGEGTRGGKSMQVILLSCKNSYYDSSSLIPDIYYASVLDFAWNMGH